MARADAWLVDPFGAALGRWGGSASGSAPAWWDPIVAILTSGGATGYLWLHEVGIPTSVGQPVEAWEDVTGTVTLDQPGASSLRPILQADSLAFDGIDDRLLGPAEVAALTATPSGPWTIGAGGPTITISATRVLWCAGSPSTASVVELNARMSLVRGGGTTIFSVLDPPSPFSAWISISGGGTGEALRRVSGVEATATYGTQAAGIDRFTVGAERLTTTRNFFAGSMSWFIATNRGLSSVDMAVIEAILTANGYPI